MHCCKRYGRRPVGRCRRQSSVQLVESSGTLLSNLQQQQQQHADLHLPASEGLQSSPQAEADDDTVILAAQNHLLNVVQLVMI